jgi:hypothetical protein
MGEYTKPCTTCKKEIRMSNNTGRWLPSNLDGSAHRCFGKKEEREKEEKPELKNLLQAQILLEGMDGRLSILLFCSVMKVMNAE